MVTQALEKRQKDFDVVGFVWRYSWALSPPPRSHLRPGEYAPDGTVADHAALLQEGGFEIGQLIERKADRVMAKLGNKAVFLFQDGPLSGWATVSVASLLMGEWKKAAPKVDDVELPDFHCQRVPGSCASRR